MYEKKSYLKAVWFISLLATSIASYYIYTYSSGYINAMPGPRISIFGFHKILSSRGYTGMLSALTFGIVQYIINSLIYYCYSKKVFNKQLVFISMISIVILVTSILYGLSNAKVVW